MIKYVQPISVDDKFKLMEFVFKNTDSFILNTFGFVWESRNWWGKQPIMIYTDKDNNILGLHAFSINTRKPDTIKTYYIVVDKALRGKGIAKKLTVQALQDNKTFASNYFVNSEENSDGVKFYNKLFYNKYTTHKNEFGTLDYYYEAPVADILK